MCACVRVFVYCLRTRARLRARWRPRERETTRMPQLGRRHFSPIPPKKQILSSDNAAEENGLKRSTQVNPNRGGREWVGEGLRHDNCQTVSTGWISHWSAQI